MRHAHALNREQTIADHIPQSSHIAPDTLITLEGTLQRMYRVGGIPFETVEPFDVHEPKERLNTLIQSIGSDHVALTTHTCCVSVTANHIADYPNEFARTLASRHVERVAGESLKEIQLYLTITYKPEKSGFMKTLVRASRRTVKEIIEDQRTAIQSLDEIAGQVESALQSYNIRKLTTYQHDDALYSEQLEFLHYLLSGKRQRVRVPNCPINEYIGNAWVFAGTESLEIRAPSYTRYAQAIEFKDYPGHTEPGQLDGLLYLPFEFVITQSYVCYDKQHGIEVLNRQRTHMINVQDGSGLEQIDAASSGLKNGQFSMGEYCFVMLVYGETPEQAREHTRQAVATIEQQGFIVCLSTLAADAAFFSQLPGNWRYRPRIAYPTSRNFAGMACLHSFPQGKATGNPWGPCVALLSTPAQGLYNFNFHAERHGDQSGAMLLGNTRIIGQSGRGKTTLLNTLYTLSQQYDNGEYSTVLFDKDQSSKATVLANGGKYQSFKNGDSTGLNPFQLEPTEANILFLEELVQWLAGQGDRLSVADDRAITHAVRTVMRMELKYRRLSTVLQNITEPASTRENSLVMRLAKWCHDDGNGKTGALAWVLDNETDCIDLSTHSNYGFDGSEFIDNDRVRTPITMYLLHRMREVIDGRRFIHWMVEAWKWLDDPVFAKFAGDEQLTIRKKNGFVVLETQQPGTVLKSSVSDELLQQIATEIYLPNPRATVADYVEGFGLTETEFKIVQSLPDDDYLFLVKQGSRSVVAQLDLTGFKELSILAGSADTNALIDRLINSHGDDWLPRFYELKSTL